jgi:hypothetical protein
MDPEYVGALTLMLAPGTPLYQEAGQGAYVLPDQLSLLAELGVLLANTNLSQGMFTANHASNYLPIRAYLPQDKDKVLHLIKQALQGEVNLRPEWMRAF